MSNPDIKDVGQGCDGAETRCLAWGSSHAARFSATVALEQGQGGISETNLAEYNLPQHSGRSGRLERSHPPPRAWISNTVFAIRRPKILTAVTSSPRAALCAVVTSR
jgi:hypothetical protein